MEKGSARALACRFRRPRRKHRCPTLELAHSGMGRVSLHFPPPTGARGRTPGHARAHVLPDFIAAVSNLNIQVWGTYPLQYLCCKSTLELVRTMLRLHSLSDGIIMLPRPPSQPFNIKLWSPSCHTWQGLRNGPPTTNPISPDSTVPDIPPLPTLKASTKAQSENPSEIPPRRRPDFGSQIFLIQPSTFTKIPLSKMILTERTEKVFSRFSESQCNHLIRVRPHCFCAQFFHHCSLGTTSMSTYYLRTLQASNIEKSTIDVKKEQRGVMATQTAASTAGAKTFTAEEKNACSIDAMLNGGTCEACQ